MPRVLVVTHDWLPGFDAEVKRVANLCRYLPATGWSPHILTTNGPRPNDLTLSDDEIARSPSLKFASSLPVTRAPGSMADAGLAAVRQFGIGAVMSVCPPALDHVAGGEIARRAGIPWVALFDDLDALYIGPADGRSSLERRRAASQARSWLRDVWRVGAGTTRTLEYLRQSFDVEGDVVAPAYDPDERRLAPHRDPSAPLRIVHAGAIDRVTQTPTVLFDALDAFVATEPDARDAVQLDVVESGIDEFLRARLAGRACEPMVRLHARVEPYEVARMQRESDLLVTLRREDPIARALGGDTRAATELVELFCAARPIVVVGEEEASLTAALLRDTGAGEVVGDALSLAALFRRARAEVSSSGALPFRGEESVVGRYAATEQVKRVAALLDAASAARFGSWQRARR